MIYVKDRKCDFCLTEFKQMRNVDFANHKRWCFKNPKRKDSYKNCGAGISRAASKRKLEKCGVIKKFVVHCAKCTTNFIVEEGEKAFPKKEKYFCTISCANSNKPSIETCKKISDGVKHSEKAKRANFIRRKPGYSKRIRYKQVCTQCENEFLGTVNLQCKLCRNEARRSLIRSKRAARDNYKRDCQFNFALSEYPDKFNFNLVEDYGWYRPSTHKNPNLNGVSRDHIISISFGFKNNINPNIIRHPANCDLLRHKENLSKSSKCGMTLDELLDKIKSWIRKD